MFLKGSLMLELMQTQKYLCIKMQGLHTIQVHFAD